MRLVVIMTPATFDEAYPMYSNLFNKSGLVRMSSWPEETLIAIAEDRFLGLEKDLSIPVRNVSKACAIIHLQMTQEPTRRYRYVSNYRGLISFYLLILSDRCSISA